MYLDGFLVVSIYMIHLNHCPRTPFLDNCDVFWPELTNIREKHMFLHFPMWVFTKHLTFVFRCVYFCEHIWDSLELLPPELDIWPIWMFSGRIWPKYEKNTCFCTFQWGFSPKTLIMYLDGFIFVSIHGIHLRFREKLTLRFFNPA